MSKTHGWNNNVVAGYELQCMSQEKIKPCPFCKAHHVALWLGPVPHMTCGFCGADGPTVERQQLPGELFERQRLAVRLWNTRSA